MLQQFMCTCPLRTSSVSASSLDRETQTQRQVSHRRIVYVAIVKVILIVRKGPSTHRHVGCHRMIAHRAKVMSYLKHFGAEYFFCKSNIVEMQNTLLHRKLSQAAHREGFELRYNSVRKRLRMIMQERIEWHSAIRLPNSTLTSTAQCGK